MVQKGALAALEGPQNSVDEMVSEFKRRRNLVVKRLDDMGIECSKPHGAFYVFPMLTILLNLLKKDWKRELLWLMEEHLEIHGKNHVRLSYATSYNQLEEAMNRLESMNI